MSTASDVPNQVVVTLRGEYDIARKDELNAALAAADRADLAVIDLEHVTYLDSTAIGALIALKKRMASNGRRGDIRIEGASPTILRVFKLCALDRVFEIVAGAAPAV